MAATIQVDGLASIYTCFTTLGPTSQGFSPGVLQLLGYTENGSEITEQNYPYDVMGDENGGDAGPPIDIQQMGEVHTIRLLFTKYDENVANVIGENAAFGVVGAPLKPGYLQLQGNFFWRLVINTPLRPRNYTRVIFREPKEINKGTKHSKAMFIGTAYRDPNNANRLYDTTIS